MYCVGFVVKAMFEVQKVWWHLLTTSAFFTFWPVLDGQKRQWWFLFITGRSRLLITLFFVYSKTADQAYMHMCMVTLHITQLCAIRSTWLYASCTTVVTLWVYMYMYICTTPSHCYMGWIGLVVSPFTQTKAGLLASTPRVLHSSASLCMSFFY